MSVYSEISDLNTNLAAAKAAVTAKGGTVGDTGLAGLADEIATIPSGGGGATSLSITNKSDFASPIAMPTNGTFTQVSLSVTTDPVGAYYFVESSDPTVAKIVYDNGGYAVRFIAPGTATITAYSGSVSDTVSVSATQSTTALTLNGLPAFCDKGTTYQLTVTYTPSTSATNGVNWSSSDTSVATVDSDGLVTFVDTGSVTITATSKTQTSVTKTTSGTVVVNETDPDFDTLHSLIQAGTASQTYPVGSTLNVQYKEGTNPAETMPIKVMGYTDNAVLEGGTTVKGMIIRPLCNRTNIRYSGTITIVSLTASSGETTAQDGYYYYTNANVPLNLQTGDPLDFSTNPTIKKTDINVSSANALSALINYGDRRWAYSNARSWLNSTYLGYYSSSFTSHLGKVKVTTVNDKYSFNGEVVDAYDYFYLPSNVELLAGVVNGTNYTQDQVDNEGTVLQYFVDLAGTSTPNFNATAQNNARLWPAVNAQTTNQNNWTRSVDSGGSRGWCVGSSGYVYYSGASGAFRLAPLAVLI